MNSISRRAALSGLTCVSCGTLMSNDRLAMANLAGLEPLTTKTEGGRHLRAFLSLPVRLPAPAVLTVHGSLGLTKWYRSQAAEFAKEGFVGLAVDLFPGQLARDLDGEQRLIEEADANSVMTIESLVSWVQWLKTDPRTTGTVGIVGWSFGAWWALKASIATGVEATVIYYGLKYGKLSTRDDEAAELARLRGPVLALKHPLIL